MDQTHCVQHQMVMDETRTCHIQIDGGSMVVVALVAVVVVVRLFFRLLLLLGVVTGDDNDAGDGHDSHAFVSL